MRRLTVAAVLALALAGAACSSNTNTKTTTETSTVGSSATTVPKGAEGDAAIQTCDVDVLKIAHAKGQITNRSSKASNYLLHVGFFQGATRVAEGYGSSNNVAPNQVAVFDAVGSPQVTNGQPITCQMISVDRHASP